MIQICLCHQKCSLFNCVAHINAPCHWCPPTSWGLTCGTVLPSDVMWWRAGRIVRITATLVIVVPSFYCSWYWETIALEAAMANVLCGQSVPVLPGLVTGFCSKQCCPCSRRACSQRALREDLPPGRVTGNAESQKTAIFPHSSIQKNSVTVAMNN